MRGRLDSTAYRTHTPGPAAWYADPRNPDDARWWDGLAWTDAVAAGRVITMLPPAGMYPDPHRPGGERWWTGSAWAGLDDTE